MLNKESLLKNLHKFYRQDPYIENLMSSYGSKLEALETNTIDLSKEFNFDTMSEVGIAIMEEQLDYNCISTSLDGKREEIEGRWKTAGKCDLKLLQTIANAWRNGEVAIMFTNACIKITFISIVGIPRNVEALKSAIEEAKPAHLPVEYTFRYRTWGNLLQNTWGYYKQFTWGEVLKKEGV